MTHEIAAAWVVGGFIMVNRPIDPQSPRYSDWIKMMGICIIIFASSIGMQP